jgi:esterase/lipase
MSAIIIGDSVIHYESVGRGKPVLFLHNYIGSWRYWVPTMEYLSGHFRTYAVDLWGFGDSSKHESLYDLITQANLISHFLKELGIPKIALVGHGFGSLVGYAFADQHPDQVDRFFSVVEKEMPKTTCVGDLLIAGKNMDEDIRKDSLKADPRAITRSIEIFLAQNDETESSKIQFPHLSIGSGIDKKTIPLATGEFFPMITHAEEFNRLLLEFLTGDSTTIETGLAVKEFWKRRVR